MNYTLALFYDTGEQNNEIASVIGTYAEQQLRGYIKDLEIDGKSFVTMIRYISTTPTIATVRAESFTGYSIVFSVSTKGLGELESIIMSQAIRKYPRRVEYDIGSLIDFSIT